MVKVTPDLKQTLISCPHIEKVYFDKFGKHYFNVHQHEGKLYHRIKNLSATVTDVDDTGKYKQPKKKLIIEAHPDHEIVDVLEASEVLSMQVEDQPLFQDKDSGEIFEKQAQENARLRKELEDLKNDKLESGLKGKGKGSNPDTSKLMERLEKLEQELAATREENLTYQQLLEETSKEKSSDNSPEVK